MNEVRPSLAPGLRWNLSMHQLAAPIKVPASWIDHAYIGRDHVLNSNLRTWDAYSSSVMFCTKYDNGRCMSLEKNQDDSLIRVDLLHTILSKIRF